ncbi:exodeoxyribonuclease V subunit beta [Blochmannia endosymbiont of Polyrhachis (Hedomyrma) turneri]|uniref:exodeoxyribonuclease V subunit beta n=1 Tax=Blochmannia endosymbiont of Polyrhachis (Hedomyrma) turneri TaxID=1505596 RepID=UPI001FDFCA9B|nr:exodeoxyribonuclease V subunit beta [Blochmannia endosymbiont of Polyrhachis (Hedomyrma) turneri]
MDDGLHVHDKNGKLLQSIRKTYPIAIVDEFQDTDFQQYRIFHTLYSSRSQSKYGLLLVGDPKQSIYSFRGADIFSYLLARKHVDFYYTLNTNWRASKGIVNAINKLFNSNTSFSPFIFQKIPFITMRAAKDNNRLRFVVKNKSYPSFCFYLPSYHSLTVREYQKIMAFHCATTIRDLLCDASYGQAWLQSSTCSKKLLESSDIVVLVRNSHEGNLISSVLNQFNISNVYLSNQKNIFETLEAFDLLLILQAILLPEDNNILRCALMTGIIGYNAQKIEFINQNENDWKKEVNAFVDYHSFWKKYGVQSMLQEIIFRRHIFKHLAATQDGKSRLINILHLAEILQKYSVNLHDESSLVNWLKKKIYLSNNLSCNDQLLRSTDNDRLIKIITIHKSKGLEFPLVFLPFVSILHKKKYPLFHDRENYHIYLDLSNSSRNINLSDEEGLSEDLRLFYVAVTRAIYHCFIGIGSISFKKRIKKNQCCNDLHRTALGYLVQKGVPGNFYFLEKCLIKLVESAQGDIMLNYISNNKNQENCKLLIDGITNNDLKNKNNLSARNWKIQINTKYTVTSYSELYHSNTFFSSEKSLMLNKQIICTAKNNKQDGILFTPYSFPQGKESGVFLHHIFQKWNFKKKINAEWLSLQLMQYGISLTWLPILQMWMDTIASMPLNNENFVLSQLSSSDYRTEFEFYLSVKSLVSAEKFDNICKNYDPISRLSSPLTFPDILGMIHGFIDLVFRWKGKYYLLDYKSNWLGGECHDYSLLNIKNEMIFRHYALQYQIYTLALHRFLRHKLISYNYKKDFGGVYYLFLRGIDLVHSGNGIYFCLPDQRLIDELDELLSICQ